MVVREGLQQAQRRSTANGISKKWRITRRNKRPRGLVNQQNSCYRHGALQPLLHLPRFVNWIKTHNVLNHWPCHANDPNRQLPTDPLTLRAIERKMTEAKAKNIENYKEDDAYKGCVPCLLKKLMTAYWNNTLIGPNLVPRPLPHHHPAILPLHQLIERWYCIDPPSDTHTGNQGPIAARRDHMTAQQDADEFTGYIFDGIESSYDRLTIHGAVRGAECDSLFGVRKRVIHTCSNCHHTIVDRFEEEPRGLRIIPNNNNNDTVANAIARTLTGTYKGRCSACKVQKSNFTETHTIVAAPEYLRICLSLAQITKGSTTNEYGKTVVVATLTKNPNHIIIPDTLDLTQHMDYVATMQNPDPVRYKLVSATFHRGDQLNAGHYTAAVTGPALPGQRIRPQFFCDDANITNLPPTAAHPNAITQNPIQGDFDAVTLYYERITPTGGTLTPANKLSKADLEVVEEGKTRSDPPPRRKGDKEGNRDEKKGDRSKKRKNDETKDNEVQEEKTQKKGRRKGKGKASENEQELKKRVNTSRSMDQSSSDALQQAYDLSKTSGALDQSIWTAFGQLNNLSKTLKNPNESS